MIDSAWFEKYLDERYDYDVISKLRSYPNAIILPENIYTIVLHFIIHEDGETDNKISPFNKTAYRNFLFELNVTAIGIKREVHTVN